MKFCAEIAVFCDVATCTVPLAPAPRIAVICVGLLTVKNAAFVPPTRTDATLANPLPVMMTDAPCPPLVGVKEVIDAGGSVKVNGCAEMAVLLAVTTCIMPLAPAATTAVICVGLLTVNDCAATPPKRTALTFTKFVPDMTTEAPCPPLAGLKDVIEEVCATTPATLRHDAASARVRMRAAHCGWNITSILLMPPDRVWQ